MGSNKTFKVNAGLNRGLQHDNTYKFLAVQSVSEHKRLVQQYASQLDSLMALLQQSSSLPSAPFCNPPTRPMACQGQGSRIYMEALPM